VLRHLHALGRGKTVRARGARMVSARKCHDDDEDEDDDEDDEDDEDDDEDEPDEDEPDEDEVGPDFDDLTDDEYQGNAAALYPPADAPSSSPHVATPGDVDLDLDGVPTEYPGDDAPRERIAAWMAGEAERRGLPPELPVMAALVESGMHNLPGGDADSVGFFQMRTSIWDQGE
jgi:cobalamin biosynthesis protein CobT